MAHLFPTFWSMVAHLVDRDIREPYGATSCIGKLRSSLGSVAKGTRIQLSACDEDDHVKLQYRFVDGEWLEDCYIVRFNNYNPRIITYHAAVECDLPSDDNNVGVPTPFPSDHARCISIVDANDHYIEPMSRIIFDHDTHEALGLLDQDNTTVLPLEPADVMFCDVHNLRVSSSAERHVV